ncbi:hypothetical protein J2W28_004282 [Variovorax boronicumulans]|nr:IS3 family transposase [Variovorax boronicumulans]MDP9994017.1 hypothetical protein [Variovorax boronicumulans]MDQ0005120.1 hypothetical protein [Variovorax boronicumulans]
MVDLGVTPVLQASMAGYHERVVRRARAEQRRHLSADALLVQIKAIHAQTHGSDGWPRTWRELLVRGIRVGKERVRRLMQLHRIRAKPSKPLRDLAVGQGFQGQSHNHLRRERLETHVVIGDVQVDPHFQLDHAGETVAPDALVGGLARSTMFSHDALVGVKCVTKRGSLASHFFTSGWLCVA